MNTPLMKIFIFLCLIQLNFSLHAQVSISPNNAPPNGSAMLDVQSTNKGFAPPRMTSNQRRNIVAPLAGLIVYDTDRQTLFFFNGNMWKALIAEPVAAIAAISGVDASDGATGDNFGANVAIYGNYAIAAAYRDDSAGAVNRGAAYIFKFENGNWVQMQKVMANDGQTNDEFGFGVAIDSSYAFVGATNATINGSINQGCVYVFKLENNVWVQKQKITSVNAASGDIFGGSLSCNNGMLAITASKDDVGPNNDQGSAYVFKLESATGLWVEVQKLTANDGTAGDAFGYWISLDSNKVIVSAVYDDVNGLSQKGSAYIFTLQSGVWSQTIKLFSNDGTNGDNFGRSVSIQGDYALVGSYFSDISFTNQGAAYLFKLENGTWTQKQKITASDPTTNGYFGSSVSLKNNYASIGSFGINGSRGATYVFTLNPATNTLAQIQKITAIDAAANDYFGYTSALSNTDIIIGAFGKNSERGKIYFKLID